MSVLFRGLALLSFLLLAPFSAAHDGHERVDAGQAWVRAMPPGAMNSAAYLKLYNHGKATVSLVGATTPAAKTVELHAHLHENGMMLMRQVERIEIPSQAEAVLEPGGYHLMLMGLTGPLNDGDSMTLTLQFDNNTTAEVTATVMRDTPDHSTTEHSPTEHSTTDHSAH